MPSITAYCDGGSRGNPGPAGFGVSIEGPEGERIAALSEYLGTRTNNYAEYSALLAALQYALDHGHAQLRVIADSELMVKQMKGQYRVNSPDLKPLWEEAKRRAAKLERFEITHVLRNKNKHADQLANEAMDRGMGRGAKSEPDRGMGRGAQTEPDRGMGRGAKSDPDSTSPSESQRKPAHDAAPQPEPAGRSKAQQRPGSMSWEDALRPSAARTPAEPAPMRFGVSRLDRQTGSQPDTQATAPETSHTAAAPAAQRALPAEVTGFVKNGVVHLVEGELPEGTFVRILPARR